MSECVLDGETHVRVRELGEDGAIGELDHGVDDGLGVNDCLDAIHEDAEKPAGFDHFEAFIEEGGRVDGDFRPHVPSGVVHGHFRGDVDEVGGWGLAEGASGGGEDEAGDLRIGAAVAFEALENGVVFGIDWKDSHAFIGGARGDDFPGHDKDFLRCDGKVFPGFDGGEGGLEACGADDGDENDIGLGEGGDFRKAFGSEVDFHVGWEEGAEFGLA